MEEKDDDKRACLLPCVQFTLYAYFSFPISSEKIGKSRNNKVYRNCAGIIFWDVLLIPRTINMYRGTSNILWNQNKKFGAATDKV